MTQHDVYAAHFNAHTSGVIIEHLDISDRDVQREAQRWTTGERGPIVDDPDLLAAVDLTNLQSSLPAQTGNIWSRAFRQTSRWGR